MTYIVNQYIDSDIDHILVFMLKVDFLTGFYSVESIFYIDSATAPRNQDIHCTQLIADAQGGVRVKVQDGQVFGLKAVGFRVYIGLGTLNQNP